MGIRTAIVCTALMAIGVPAALTHPGGHGDEELRPAIGEDTAKRIAQAAVADFVAAEKVEGTWKLAELQGLERVYLRGGMQWVATFDDQTQPENKQVFIFLLPYGKFVAANFSGN